MKKSGRQKSQEPIELSLLMHKKTKPIRVGMFLVFGSGWSKAQKNTYPVYIAFIKLAANLWQTLKDFTPLLYLNYLNATPTRVALERIAVNLLGTCSVI
jgi:hypothetical protein